MAGDAVNLNLKDLRKFDAYNIAYHGGMAYLYRARFGDGRYSRRTKLRRMSTKWIAQWMTLWPKGSYEVLASVSTDLSREDAKDM